MFVRWRRKQRVDRNKLGPLLCAELVESHRVDCAPRQKTIAYLGGIREDCIGVVPGRHIKFWEGVTERLDKLGDDLAPDERENIEEVLAKRVRRATEAERAALIKFLTSPGLTKSV